MKRPVSWLYCSSSCLVTLFLNMFNICSTVIVMFQQYTCDGLCIIICSSYLEGDLQTLSLFLHFVFGSHMAKTKPSAKSQPKKPLATPAKQFTTKPVTKLSKKPAATSLSKKPAATSLSEESIGSRCEKRDDSPQFQDYSSFRTFTDAVAISMDLNGVPMQLRNDGVFSCKVVFSKVSGNPTRIEILAKMASHTTIPIGRVVNECNALIRPSPHWSICSDTSDMGR